MVAYLCQLNFETKYLSFIIFRGEQLAPYTQLSFDPFENPKKHCDEVVETPVYFVQLDATGNMYHHFCDFFNLYVTQLTNNSWFGTENKVVRWEYVSLNMVNQFLEVSLRMQRCVRV